MVVDRCRIRIGARAGFYGRTENFCPGISSGFGLEACVGQKLTKSNNDISCTQLNLGCMYCTAVYHNILFWKLTVRGMRLRLVN